MQRRCGGRLGWGPLAQKFEQRKVKARAKIEKAKQQAATQIQAGERGRKARKQLQLAKERREGAAVAIQVSADRHLISPALGVSTAPACRLRSAAELRSTGDYPCCC